MILIFTKNNYLLSRVIRWLFNEPVSHFGIVFDNKILFHSNLKGVHLEWYEKFKEKNNIIYSLYINLNLYQQEDIYQKIIKIYANKPYDYKGLIYFGYRGFLLKFFNKPLPNDNEWDNINNFLCTEIAYCLSDYLNISKNLNILTPYKLYESINGQI